MDTVWIVYENQNPSFYTKKGSIQTKRDKKHTKKNILFFKSKLKTTYKKNTAYRCQ